MMASTGFSWHQTAAMSLIKLAMSWRTCVSSGRDIAIALHTQQHRAVSLALVAKALGATKPTGLSTVRRRRFSWVSIRGRPQTRGRETGSEVLDSSFPDAPSQGSSSSLTSMSMSLGQVVSSGLI